MAPEAFAREVENAIAELPSEFREAVANVAVLVEEEPDAETMAEMGLAAPEELLGLYRGVPMPNRGAFYAGAEPDRVSIYRRPILAEAERWDLDVADCVRNVLIHELGHYLGFDDEQLEAIEYGDEP